MPRKFIIARNLRLAVGTVLVALIIACAVAGLWGRVRMVGTTAHRQQGDDKVPLTPPQADPLGVASVPNGPVPAERRETVPEPIASQKTDEVSTGEGEGPGAADARHELMAKVTKRCWVRVIADGKVVFERTMVAGESASWRAEESIRIRVGNAGAIGLTFDGVEVAVPRTASGVVELDLPGS